MALEGILGNGSKVGFSASSPVSWTNVPQILEVEFPTFMYDEEETTVSSTTSNLKRHMPAMADVRELVITCLYDGDPDTAPAYESIYEHHLNRSTIWWRTEIPVNRAKTSFRGREFEGWVKGYEIMAPVQGRQELKITVRFDGEGVATYDPAASAIS